jgi:hypothetical protein
MDGNALADMAGDYLCQGITVKFSGDLVCFVLIRGSTLDQPLKDGAVTLTHAGFQRHRLLWVREMTEEETGDSGSARRGSSMRWNAGKTTPQFADG